MANGASYGIVRTKKLSNFGSIKASAEHTYRERLTKNADPERTGLNYGIGPRSAQGVMDAVKKRLEAVKVSSDSVLCVEYFVGASPEFFKEKPAQIEKFFADSLREIQRKHGKKNVIAGDIQLDELTPHLVVYVVPIVEKPAEGTRKRSVKATKEEFESTGNKTKIIEVPNKSSEHLGAKTYFGTRARMRFLQDEFHQNVFQKYGLTRGKPVEETAASHQDVQRYHRLLKPQMEEAERIIKQAAIIKKEQADKERELGAFAGKLAAWKKDLMAAGKSMEEWGKRLELQRDAVMKAFALMPGTLQDQMQSIFQEPSSKPKATKPTPDPALPPDADSLRPVAHNLPKPR